MEEINEAMNINPSPTTKSDTGLIVTIPAGAFYCVTAQAIFSNASAVWVGIGYDDSPASCYSNANTGDSHASCTLCGFAQEETKFHIWAQWTGTSNNIIQAKGFYIMPKS